MVKPPLEYRVQFYNHSFILFLRVGTHEGIRLIGSQRMVGMDTVRSLPEALGAEVWEMDMSLFPVS